MIAVYVIARIQEYYSIRMYSWYGRWFEPWCKFRSICLQCMSYKCEEKKTIKNTKAYLQYSITPGKPVGRCLRRCLSLRERLAYAVPPLLQLDHHVETLEVAQLAAVGGSSQSFGPRWWCPFFIDFVGNEALANNTGTTSSGKFWDSKWGQGKVTVWVSLLGYTSGWSVNDSLFIDI